MARFNVYSTGSGCKAARIHRDNVHNWSIEPTYPYDPHFYAIESTSKGNLTVLRFPRKTTRDLYLARLTDKAKARGNTRRACSLSEAKDVVASLGLQWATAWDSARVFTLAGTPSGCEALTSRIDARGEHALCRRC